MTTSLPQVGAPDPELKTTPIFDEDDEISLDLELEAGVCYFNDVAYPIGEYVMRGARCCAAKGGVSGYARAKPSPEARPKGETMAAAEGAVPAPGAGQAPADIAIVAGDANRELAQDVARLCSARLIPAVVTAFADGGTRVRIEAEVSSLDLYFVQSTGTDQ